MGIRGRTKQSETRHRAQVLLLGLLCLPACQALGLSSPRPILSWTIAIPTETAAWLVSAAAQEAFPGTDPVPWHRGAPALHPGESVFCVRYTRRHRAGTRVHLDGRLLPPPSWAAGVGSGRAATFAPSSSSGTVGACEEVFAVTISTTATGARIEVTACAAADLPRRLASLLELAAALEQARQHLDAGQFECARRTAASALAGTGSTLAGIEGEVVARLFLCRALAEQALGEDPAALVSAGLARAADRTLRAAELLCGILFETLGRDREAASTWQTVLQGTLDPSAASLAASRLAQIRDRLDQPASGPAQRLRALQLQERGAPRMAAHLLRTTRALAPDPRADCAAELQWALRSGAQRLAYDRALELYGMDPNPAHVFLLIEQCAALDLPAQGLRLIARHWEALRLADADRVRLGLATHTAALGPESAVRILTAEGHWDLARAALPLWIQTGTASSAGVRVLQRLLDRDPKPPGLPERSGWPGYREAPGIAPPR